MEKITPISYKWLPKKEKLTGLVVSFFRIILNANVNTFYAKIK
jgi:hypothetical protein